MDKLVEITEVEIPEAMVKSELDSMIQNYEANMMQQGLSLAQFLKITNQTVDQLRDSMKDDANKRIKINLALSEIAKSGNTARAVPRLSARMKSRNTFRKTRSVMILGCRRH